MARQTLRASSEGVQKIKQVLKRNKWTRESLGIKASCSRQTIWTLLKGKAIDFDTFMEICSQLELNSEEIAEAESEEEPQEADPGIDALVQEVREKVRLNTQSRCGTMRVLDMTHPIGLRDIYTDVNILEKATRLRQSEIDELLEIFEPEDFDRFGLGWISEKRVPGLDVVERYPRLMVFGKPGAGKTTFLKYLAIQCITGGLQQNRVPVFITLKDFAETPNQPSLLEFIIQDFTNCGVTATQTAELLKQGRVLILFDGLDEVREEDSLRVIKQIKVFTEDLFFSENFKKHSQKYSSLFKSKKFSSDEELEWLCDQFPKNFYTNYFVITCRIAAREEKFDKFTDVEVADFDIGQIETFARKWFPGKERNPADLFLQQLINNPPILELANNPLLLTLLCLVFQQTADFPLNRSELYKEGVDILLKKWDGQRVIKREQVYKELPYHRKEYLLSYIALSTFERKEYFFKQRDAERYIAEYIYNLPETRTEPESLQLDSAAVLKLVEAQHGLLVERARNIYSFSHLTFHEYFAARKIVNCSDPQVLNKSLKSLANHVNEKRWREVFLLTIEMLPDADYLIQLMKQQINRLLAFDEKLQQFLMWLNQKSLDVKLTYNPVAVRIFYFDLGCPIDNLPNPKFYRDFDRTLDYSLDRALDLTLSHTINSMVDLTSHLIFDPDLKLYPSLNLHLPIDRALGRVHNCVPELEQELKQLKEQLPDKNSNKKTFQRWCESNSQSWIEALRAVIIKHRNIGHKWHFSVQEKKLLKQYYQANIFLFECLNTRCYMSRNVRQKIKETFLLPIE